MGIDGFSMSNLGLNRNLTSAQLAHEADMVAKQALDNQIADMDGIGKKEKAGRKDPDAAFNGTIPFIPDATDEEDQDSEQNENQENTEDTKNEDQSKPDEEGSQYHFRMNEDGLIEIWNTKNNQLVKTISPEKAANAILGMTKTPGILVNKKI